jgi:branched-chain amino acid transport system permease protein
MTARGRRLLQVAAFGAFAVAVALVPLALDSFQRYQFALVAMYFVAITGLNVLTGYTGQISLGHGAFMAIGGYTTAILVADHGVSEIATIPLAGLVAGGAGLLFGIPALRLSGMYLALATFAVATPAVLKEYSGFTGGVSGKALPLHSND